MKKDRVSEGCEQSKVANVCLGREEDSVLQGSLSSGACGGDSGLGTRFFRHRTNYIPPAFVLFWQRLAEASTQPTCVSLNYKATSEGSTNVTERGESHWKC